MLKRILGRRKCGRPPKGEVPRSLMDQVALPEKGKVLARLAEVVRDETVRRAVEALVDAVYSLPSDHDFMEWIRYHAVRYRIYNREREMIDFILNAAIAFVAYCKEVEFGIKGPMTRIPDIKPEDLKTPQCNIVAILYNELYGLYAGEQVSRFKLVGLARKWMKEVGRIEKLWDRIEENWCRW